MPTPDDAGVVGDPIVEVAAGYSHTCARRSSGRVLCWGLNDFGQLGDGTTENRLAPTAVVDLNDAVQIEAGAEHTCARRRDGTVVCWGRGFHGQLGNGTSYGPDTVCSSFLTCLIFSRPTPVAGLADAVDIAAGYRHTCAVRGDGHVFCWGTNLYGAIGDGTCSIPFGPEFGPQPACSETLPRRSSPTEVMGLTDAVEVTAGSAHNCARRASGEVLCWGANFPNTRTDDRPDGIGGAVGDGTTTNRLVPTRALGLTGAVQLSAGGSKSCARRAGGDVFCWGNIVTNGALGDGATTTARLVPTPVLDLADVVEIRAGVTFTCARLGSGGVRCWGFNGDGQIGDDTTSGFTSSTYCIGEPCRLAPTDVVDLVDAAGLAAGLSHSCALRRDGSVVCWGQNDYGQLGDGTTTNRPAPRAVRGL
jgi:alpha-tubulin suppressor-like RCC1 family protein